MATIQEALDSARALGTMFTHMGVIAAKLEELSSLDNHERELRSAIAAATAAAAKAKDGYKTALDAENGAIAQCEQKCADMERDADVRIQESAEKSRAAAEAVAASMVTAAESRLAAATAEYAQLTTDIDSARSRHSAATAELATIEKKLSAVKATMAKFLEA